MKTGDEHLKSKFPNLSISLLLVECCIEVIVKQVDPNQDEAFNQQWKSYTTYRMQPGLVNGKVHYMSDNNKVITFCGKQWNIQTLDNR